MSRRAAPADGYPHWPDLDDPGGEGVERLLAVLLGLLVPIMLLGSVLALWWVLSG